MTSVARAGWPDSTDTATRLRLRSVGRFARRQPIGFVCGLFIVALLMIAVFGEYLAPQDYDDFDIPNRLASPSLDHPFGTDDQGRDVLSRVLYGARSSLLVGFGAVAISTVLSTLIGAVSGYYRGRLDTVLQRFIDFWLAFPGIIFVIFVVSILGASTGALILVLGLLWTARYSRVVRGGALQISTQTYVEAARVTGATDLRIMAFHVLPNIVPIVIVNASVTVGAVIIAESSLSFLGFGTPPPFPSWGRMLNDAQPYMVYDPYLAVFPGLAIALTVYAFNMFGDSLRDVLDPRMRGTR